MGEVLGDRFVTMLEDAVVAVACAKEGCTNFLPLPGEPGYHRLRKYCDDDQPKQSSGAAKRRAKLEPNDNEPAPTRVVNNNFTIKPTPTKSTKPTGAVAEVEAAATEMLNLVPMLLALTGDDVCTPEIANAIPNIAHQLAVLSKYHPFIKKIFISGEGSGEFMAWLGLLIVVSPVLVTVLAHHNLIPEKIANRLATAAVFGQVIAQAVNDEGGDGPSD